MKQTKLWLATIAALLCSLTANAHDFEVGGIYYNITSSTDLTVAVTYQGSSYSSYSNEYTGAVTIPETVTYYSNTYRVTSIGEYTFYNCSSLTSITLPEGVTSIGNSAFGNCSSLTSITIPEGVTSIGGYAFSGCSSLTSITIPESVTSTGNAAFDGCTSLKEVIIEDGSTTLSLGYNYYYSSGTGQGLFYDCPLETVYLGRNLSYNTEYRYGYSPFYNNNKLTSVTIGDSVAEIGGYAFSGCSSLTSITIPESVTSTGNAAFDGCTSLKEVIIEDGSTALSLGYNYYYSSGTSQGLFYDCPLEKVYLGRNLSYDADYRYGYSPFYNNTKLTSVTIGDSVTSIGSSAFYKCSSLTSIVIPEGVTSIGNSAFRNCSSLTSITLPESVTSIRSFAFRDCSRLTNLYLSSIESWLNITFSDNTSQPNYYAKNIYLNGELVTEVVLPETMTSIPEYAFRNFTHLTSITLPESVTSIGNSAFSGCSSLTSITLPESVTSIGDYAFDGCASLKEVIIEDGSTTLSLGYNYYYSSGTSQGLFYDCPLEKVYLGRNLSYSSGSSYGYSPFYNNKLTNVVISNDVTEIGQYAFYGCGNLHSLTIGSGVLSIGSNAFSTPEKVIWLTNTPPTGYANAKGSINYVANDQYTSLSNVKVYPYLSSMFEVDGVKYVPVSPAERTCDAIDCAYDSTATVINVTETASFRGIAMTVKEVMPYAFYGNKHIKEVSVLHKGNIGDYAFYGCVSLESITLGDKLTSLRDKTFCGCTSLQEIIIPESVTSVGAGCFNGCSLLSTITIPQAVTKIGDNVFKGCSKLADVIIADRTKALALGSNSSSPLFANSSSPLFADCPLDSVYIGGKITYNTTSSKGYSPFYRNVSLRTVVITDREEQIYDNEFYGCTALKNVTIGNGVKSIGDYAFSGCSSLEGFSFGSNMESIGAEAFSDCTNLTSITSHAAVPPTCGTQALDDINKWNCTLRVPSGYAAAYMAADQWKEFFFVEDVVEVEKYTLTFTVDGEVYHTDTLAHKAAVTMPETPEKEGYTFSGWSDTLTVMPAEDVTISGAFTRNSYIVTFMVDGEEYRKDTIAYNEVIELPEAPTKEGHTFSGWSEMPETMPAEDVTVSGTFIANKYLVTFTIDGVVMASDSLEYGAAIVVPDVPEREGYTFSGWGEVAETVPAHDVTYDATYTTNIYKVYYFVGAALVHTAEVAYGEAIPEYIYEPTAEGDEFLGWIGETYDTMPAHDVTYTANITNDVLQLTNDNGQLTIYDLSGRKVTNTENLKGGIYIINGRKVVIK